jgi:DNA-binding response OmpR family regulator
MLLKDKDQIVLGGAIAFRFHDPSMTSSGVNIGKLFGVWIDENNRAVWVDAIMIDPPLTAAQYHLLFLLYQHVNQIVTRNQIIHEVWPGIDASGVSEDAVRSLVKRVRERLLEASPKEYLEVIRGQGLRLREK